VWGLESNFGKFTGSRPVVTALATLGYDGRRALFRAELFEALRILDTSHMAPEDLKGSWAGAMGQPQFMPSSYLQYAVDFDEDGRVDIWKSEADVFASIANYLKAHGWIEGERWGREVRVPPAAVERIGAEIPMRASGCQAERAMTEPRVLSEWKALGVTLAGGAALPVSDLRASLVRGDKRVFLVYRNYDAIIGYNCAHPYAISVGLLADRISGN
jgi:membrane-bound lytic murein transglycosylase B